MPIPIQELLNKTLRDKQEARPKKEQTSWYVSSIGQCSRGNYLSRLGKKPDKPLDDRTLRIFDMGNMIEAKVVELLKAQDIELEEQVRVENKEMGVSGYADIVCTYKGEKEVLEVKSKHSGAFHWMVKKGEGANRHHIYQTWLYMHLLGIEKGSVLYWSKDDSVIVQFPVLLSDKKIESEVLTELNVLNTAWKSKTPPLMAETGTWQAKWCNYHQQCKEL